MYNHGAEKYLPFISIVSEAKITSTNSFKLLKKWQILIYSAV